MGRAHGCRESVGQLKSALLHRGSLSVIYFHIIYKVARHNHNLIFDKTAKVYVRENHDIYKGSFKM